MKIIQQCASWYGINYNLLMWVIACIVIIATLAVLLYLHGVFKPLTVYEEQINNPLMLYYSYKGPKESLGKQFDQITQIGKKHFKLSDYFGIYYSMPEQPLWKCVLGIIVNPGEKHKVEGFLDENSKFKFKQFETFRYIGTSIPYLTTLSFLLLPIKIPQFMEMVKDKEYSVFKGSFEIYHFNFRSKSIQLVNPLYNHELYDLFEEE